MILSKLHLDTYEAENNRSCCVDFWAIPYLDPPLKKALGRAWQVEIPCMRSAFAPGGDRTWEPQSGAQLA